MEAARICALKGHAVTLWEKNNALGGNLIPAAVPDFKDDYKLLVEYLRTQIKKSGIEVKLNKEATSEQIKSLKPDVVFVACGATHIIPDIPGIEKGIEEEKVLTAVDALLDNKSVGKSVVVIGGGLVGSETALYLAKQGKKVTILEMLDSIASDMTWGNAVDLIKLLDDNNVRMLTNTIAMRITETGVVGAGPNGEEMSLEAENVIVAVGMKSNKELEDTLSDTISEVYVIGDSVAPRRVLSAIWEGYRTARLI